VKRRFRRGRRGRIRRVIKGVLFRNLETQKKHYTEVNFNLAAGDATTPVLRWFAPWQSAFAQGTSSSQMIGSKVNLGRFYWRLNIASVVPDDVHVQVLFIRTAFSMDVTAAGVNVNNEGTQVGNTTTTAANPAQVVPNGNIPLFDVTAAPGQFTGLSPVTKINTDLVKIIWKKDWYLNGWGTTATNQFVDPLLVCNFRNKAVQIQEAQDTIDGVPRFFGVAGKRDPGQQYYLIMRAWTQTPTSATTVVNVVHRGTLTWKG